MVMEAPPSPQSVGREFVRQYYTLLHKAPNHLHRFYNHQSSFIHGGLDPPNRETAPVIGQKQIHQKIQQLNFRDCHAKITQVDSQSTLGNGVVVQVTGELSNAGHPMRRFTQTFVLAAQSPKKYYVHNDIFRYQDEIISDEECDDARSDAEEEATQDRANLPDVTPQQQQQQPPQPLAQQQQAPPQQAGINPYYGGPASGPAPAGIAQLPPQHVGQAAAAAGVPPPQAQHVLGQPPVQAAVNGHPEELGAYQGQVPHVPQVPQQNLVPSMAPLQTGFVQPSLTPPAPIEEIQPQVDEQIEEPESAYNEPEQELEQEIAPEPASNEPKTYANLLKSSPNTSAVYNTGPGQMAAVPGGQYGRPPSPPGGQGFRGGPRQQGGPRGPSQPPQYQQQGRPPMGQGPPRQDGGRPAPLRSSFNDDSMPMKNNDVNQLFLGNLPHSATDEEVREIFAEYGTIVELRILSKPSNKGGTPGGKLPPNYGFITFETPQDIQKCLMDKPIFYPKKDKNGVQLNVEEKRTKLPYQGGGGGRPSFDNRNRTGDNVGQRRGPGGPGGPGRNPPGGPTNGPNNRNNTYNRGGGPPNRGGQQNTYNRR